MKYAAMPMLLVIYAHFPSSDQTVVGIHKGKDKQSWKQMTITSLKPFIDHIKQYRTSSQD
jgi:hypothetical protein